MPITKNFQDLSPSNLTNYNRYQVLFNTNPRTPTEEAEFVALQTTLDASLVNAANMNEIISDMGLITSLTTTVKTSLVLAVNWVVGIIGDLASLTTSVKTDIVSAINSHLAEKASNSVLGHVIVDNSTILVDGNGVISASSSGTSDKGYNADFEYYYNTNVKSIALFQSDETYNQISGTQSADTTNIKIGSQSLKILASGASATYWYSTRNSITLDLSKFPDGSTSVDTDYVLIVCYISDVTKVTNVYVDVTQQATWNGTNYKAATISSGLVTGWNFLKVLKSAFTTSGTGAWTGIQSMSVQWLSTTSATNAYVSFQYIGMVRKDPSSAIPNPFQRLVNGTYTREFAINSGEWVIVNEFGKIVAKNLKPATYTNALRGVNLYGNCTIGSVIKYVNGSQIRACGLYIDVNNYFFAFAGGTSSINITKCIAGSVATATINSVLFINVGDVQYSELKRDGTTLSFKVSANSGIPVEITTEFSPTGQGYLMLPTYSNDNNNINSLSITTLEHANHASVAEVAKNVIGEGWKVIQSVTLSANAAQLDFNNISPEWKQLKIVFTASSSTATVRDLNVVLNDVVSNYNYQTHKSASTTATLTGGSSATNIALPRALGAGTTYSTGGEINIDEGYVAGAGTPNVRVNYSNYPSGQIEMYSVAGLCGGFVGKVRKISLIASADAIFAGSTFILMGVK